MFSIENPLLRRPLMLEIGVVSDGAQKARGKKERDA